MLIIYYFFSHFVTIMQYLLVYIVAANILHNTCCIPKILMKFVKGA